MESNILLGNFLAVNDSIVTQVHSDVTVQTNPRQWEYAAISEAYEHKGFIPPGSEFVGFVFNADVTVTAGAVGVGWISTVTNDFISPEVIVSACERQKLSIPVRCENGIARICIRNVEAIASTVQLKEASILPLLSVVIDDEDTLLSMMKDPTHARDIVAQKCGAGIQNYQIGSIQSERSFPVDFARLWKNDVERLVMQTVEDLNEIHKSIEISEISADVGILDNEYPKRYSRQTLIRVVKAIEMLKSYGVSDGRVLEIGAYFGLFSLCLQRMGFEVTAVDRYASYPNSLDPYLNFMRREGVKVVSMKRETEVEEFEALGEFDVVLSMAVIEHIPHTPRFFLDMLKRRTSRDGILMLETPNLARYWARKYLSEGRSVFQSIETQYYSQIPFEGHHREYTASEMKWLLQQQKLSDIKCELFDYNLFQFGTIEGEHLRMLLAMSVDETLADTVLVAGRNKENT